MSEPSPEAARAIREFAVRLRRARRGVGEPSLRKMASLMGGLKSRYKCQPSASRLHRAFEGERLPAWEVVQSLLANVMNMSDDTIQGEWLPRWVQVRDMVDPIE